jgi:hypothetical protein
MSPAQRLEVYREQFWLRHVPSLQDDYPTLAWTVGGSASFRALAVEYLEACPPCTWDLQRLGENLPTYVESHAPWSENGLARDAARLDWAFMKAFDAPDAPPLDPRMLSANPPEDWSLARIVFHPSLSVLSLAHPVHELRDALQRGVLPACSAGDTSVAVWRDTGCVIRAAALEPLARELLLALFAGTQLGEACEAVACSATDHSDIDRRVSSSFQGWTASGWVIGLRFGEQT